MSQIKQRSSGREHQNIS